MNMTTFTTYREPQIERFSRFSGFSVEVSVTPEHFSFMKSLHGINCPEPDRDSKSKQPECLSISVHAAAVYAGLQERARRHRTVNAME